MMVFFTKKLDRVPLKSNLTPCWKCSFLWHPVVFTSALSCVSVHHDITVLCHLTTPTSSQVSSFLVALPTLSNRNREQHKEAGCSCPLHDAYSCFNACFHPLLLYVYWELSPSGQTAGGPCFSQWLLNKDDWSDQTAVKNCIENMTAIWHSC